MPEIIDLISSPTTSPANPEPAPSTHSQIATPSNAILHVDLRDYGLSPFSDDLGFPASVKRRRRRRSEPENRPGKADPSHPYSFLSSDNDVVLLEDEDGGKTAVGQKTTISTELPSDPITFSSSAPEPQTVRRATRSIGIDLDTDKDDADDFTSLAQPAPPTRPALSERTSNLLASLAASATDGHKPKAVHRGVKRKLPCPSTASVRPAARPMGQDEISQPSSPKRVSGRDVIGGAAGKATGKADKERRKADKEAERERKRLVREERAREKEFLAEMAEVNRSKTDKKVSTREMLLDMPRSLEGTAVGDQVVEFMKTLDVETNFWDERVEPSEVSSAATQKGSLVRWRRKVKAEYNEEAGHWEPLAAERVEGEKQVLVYLRAQDFVEVAVWDVGVDEDAATREKAMARNVDSQVAYWRRRHGDCKPIYLIEGLADLLRKNKKARNRAYTAAVRSQTTKTDNGDSGADRAGRKKKPKPNPGSTTIGQTESDSLLLHLQLHSKIQVQHSGGPAQSAHWIRAFTEHVSTVPQRRARMRANDAVAFCMETGQVKTGADAVDSFARMLQEVGRVTPATAFGVVHSDLLSNTNTTGTTGTTVETGFGGGGGGVPALIKAFRDHGPLVLQHVRKGLDRHGGPGERALGPALSRRLYRVWTGRLADCTDGIS